MINISESFLPVNSSGIFGTWFAFKIFVPDWFHSFLAHLSQGHHEGGEFVGGVLLGGKRVLCDERFHDTFSGGGESFGGFQLFGAVIEDEACLLGESWVKEIKETNLFKTWI